uniref:Uncharacterized protein n=1 Tax=Acrobeloides nanus TaxID=290746 RepID=A0A914CWN2_9BILA
MRRLGKMLPIHMQLKNRHEDPLMLINDAATYINHLTATVVSRVQKGSLPREVLERILPQVLSPSSENISPDSTQKVSRKRLRRRV